MGTRRLKTSERRYTIVHVKASVLAPSQSSLMTLAAFDLRSSPPFPQRWTLIRAQREGRGERSHDERENNKENKLVLQDWGGVRLPADPPSPGGDQGRSPAVQHEGPP